MSINRVELSGNLTRSPELKTTTSGCEILSFGLAVNDRRKNPQTGAWDDYANFIECTMFGSRANYLSQALHKGAKVFVSGKLRYSSWENPEGKKRSKLDVVVDDLDFGFPPSQNQQQKSNPFQQLAEQPSQYQQQSYQQQQPAYQRQQQPAHEPYQQELPQPELAESDPFGSDIPF